MVDADAYSARLFTVTQHGTDNTLESTKNINQCTLTNAKVEAWYKVQIEVLIDRVMEHIYTELSYKYVKLCRDGRENVNAACD